MGGHWRGNLFQFGLIAEHVVSIRYLFYPHFFPQLERNQALLTDVQRTLHFEVTNAGWSEQAMRILINCFDKPVKFNLPEEIAWNVLIDTEKEPDEFVSPVRGIAWLEGFSVQVLRGIQLIVDVFKPKI